MAYTQLSIHATTVAHIFMYNIVNKMHFMIHVAMQARFLNPEVVGVYPFETLMGLMQRTAMSCKKGMKMRKVPRSVMTKYRMVLHFALQDFAYPGAT